MLPIVSTQFLCGYSRKNASDWLIDLYESIWKVNNVSTSRPVSQSVSKTRAMVSPVSIPLHRQVSTDHRDAAMTWNLLPWEKGIFIFQDFMGEFKTSIIPVDINKKCFTTFAIDVPILWLCGCWLCELQEIKVNTLVTTSIYKASADSEASPPNLWNYFLGPDA